jgi:hypothetical protein
MCQSLRVELYIEDGKIKGRTKNPNAIAFMNEWKINHGLRYPNADWDKACLIVFQSGAWLQSQ